MNPPVFLHPIARSGGTLLTTMLDAHPDLAMSYEIFAENLLDNAKPLDPAAVMEAFSSAKKKAPADDPAWIKAARCPAFHVFALRSQRAGLSVDDLLDCLSLHVKGGGSWSTLHGRLDFIDRLMQRKMTRVGKNYWGGKAKTDLPVLFARHPQAVYLMVVRDGRDVLASRKNVGSFDRKPAHVAQEWRERISAFETLAKDPAAKTLVLHYEKLVEQPESALTEVCRLIGIPFSRLMLDFADLDMPLYRAPHGHLSAGQIQGGLDTASIGRWRRDLSKKDVAAFESVAGDVLRAHGYSES